MIFITVSDQKLLDSLSFFRTKQQLLIGFANAGFASSKIIFELAKPIKNHFQQNKKIRT
jgi:hypothetical protein